VRRGHDDDPGRRAGERRHLEAELVDGDRHHMHTGAPGDRVVVDRPRILDGDRGHALGEQGAQ
jgi:hypothetical protein